MAGGQGLFHNMFQPAASCVRQVRQVSGYAAEQGTNILAYIGGRIIQHRTHEVSFGRHGHLFDDAAQLRRVTQVRGFGQGL